MTQLDNLNELPVPESDALAQSAALIERVKVSIQEQGGALSFDDYMSTILYEPGLGYYSAGSRKFGAAGDFVTAPEISPLFSRCLAQQCQQILKHVKKPVIMELGAGSGIMASEILTELNNLNALPEAYWIMEVSADLRQRQQKLLQQTVPFFFDRIHWLDHLPQETFNGVILANEVLDALPVKRFIKRNDGFNEQGVGLVGEQFSLIEWPASVEMVKALEDLESQLGHKFPDGYVSEINIYLQDWLAAVAKQLAHGVILILDYGYPQKEYYHPEKNTGTLLCYYRHHVHSDAFLYPGLQDITASVDFTWLAECADRTGLTVNGYTTQAYFLMASGLEKMAAEMMGEDIRQQTLTAQQIRTLTMPGEMGERIKVMALGREFNESLQGFSLMDQRIRL